MPSELQPTVTLTVSGTTVAASWPPVDGAAGYRVEVSGRSPAEVTEPRYEFTGEPGTDHTVTVTAYGPPSEPATARVPSGAQILSALRDRMIAAESDSVYPLDATVFLADQDAVRLALEDALDGTGLTVTSETTPELVDDALVLTGTSAALTGAPGTAVTLAFTVSGTDTLQATWTAAPPEPWTLADAFPILVSTPFEYVPMAAPRFVATTFAHTDEAVPFALEPGLSFHTTTTVRSDLRPAGSTADFTSGTGTATATALSTGIGGPLTVADGVPRFAWTAAQALGRLTAARVGQDALTLNDGVLFLGYGPDDAQTLTITGSLPFGTATVDLPTPLTPELALRAADPTIDGTSVTSLLDGSGIKDVFGTTLPDSLLDLAGVRPSEWAMRFAPDGLTATSTSVTFAAGSWTLIPAAAPGPTDPDADPDVTEPAPAILELADLELELTVRRAPGPGRPEPQVSHGGELRGTLHLGEGRYAVTAGIPPSGPWYLTITDTGAVPTLEVLAGLTGMESGAVTGVLPSALLDLGSSFTLREVGLLVDPDLHTLSEVAFTIVQTEPWPLVDGLLTVSDWTVELAITQGKEGWATSGTLSGTVALTAGDAHTAVALRLPVPIGDDVLWTFSLAEPIAIPTIGQVLSLLGTDPAALPVGITSVGGFELDLFSVSVDPEAVTLEHVAFGFSQSTAWEIIPGQLSVDGLTAAFALHPGTNPVGVTGTLRGNLMLCGSAVDVSVVKNEPGGDWHVYAADEDFVFVDAFNQLDAWLSGTEAAAALPDTLPLRDGFEVGQVSLVFAGDAAGALRQFGFSVYIENVWSVLGAHLELTDLSATLRMPYPVVSDQIVGALSAVLTLGGVDIAVRAAKPDTADDWEFTGTLLRGVTFDLAAAAAGLGTAVPMLPSDAVTYGLPASITIVAAEVRAVPDTGYVHVTCDAEFDWQIELGEAELAITSIGGVLESPAGGGPVAAKVTGNLEFAGLDVELGLALGGPEAKTVLTGVVRNPGAIAVPELSEGIGAPTDAEKWAAVVPEHLADLAFREAAVHLDLTGSRFVVYGSLACGTGPALDGYVHLAAPDGVWKYAVAASLGDGFRFAALLPALSAVDAHIRVAEARVVVCDLDGMPLADLRAATTPLLRELTTGFEDPLDGVDTPELALSDGVLVVAKIDFAPVTLFRHILRIGDDQTPPEVWLSALIDNTQPINTTFKAKLPTITVVEAIVFTGIELAYKPNRADLFELTGNIALTGIFDDDYAFDVKLTVDDTGLDADATQTGQAIASPFGIPDIELSGLALRVAYTWETDTAAQTSSYGFGGHVRLGPEPAAGEVDARLRCGAELDLVDGAAALFEVLLDQDFSIGAFIAQCVTGSGAAWPREFVEVTFRAGTRLWYYAAEKDPGGTLVRLSDVDDPDSEPVLPPDGFTLDAQFSVTLVDTLDLHGVISVPRDPDTEEFTGVRAAIELDEPLDLVFVSLASKAEPAPGQPYTGGPQLAFATGAHPSFELAAGVDFFGEPFVDFDVKVTEGTDGGTVFAGDVKAKAELKPFGVFHQKFRYITHPEHDDEFILDGWPEIVDWARDLVDFVEAIKALADTGDGSVCGDLARFVVRNAFTSKFSVTPTVRVSGADLVFSLTGHYRLTVVETLGGPFLEMDFPPFEVKVPASTRWQDVPEVLAVGFADASEQFALDLLADPDKIAMFLAMVTGPDALAVGTELACNALLDGAVAAAADAAAGAIEGVGGATAATAVGVATTAIGVSFAGSGHHGGDGGGDGGGGGGGGGGDDGDNGDGSGDGGDGGGGSGGGTITVEAPHLRSAVYRDGAVSGIWDAARGAAGYTFALARPDGTLVATHDFGMVLAGPLPIDADPLPPGTYQAEVRGTRGDQTSAWAGLPLTKPVGPTPELTYMDGRLTADWADVGADAYTVSFLDPDGIRMAPDQVLPGAMHTASVPLPDPETGLYSAVLRADLVDQLPGSWGERPTLDLVRLPAPTIDMVTRADGSFTVAWTPADEEGLSATGFEVRVLVDGTVAARATTAEQTAVLTADGTNGAVVQVQVRSLGTNAVSPWQSQDFAVWNPPAPESTGIHDRAGYVAVSWPSVRLDDAPSASYDVELLEDDRVVTSARGVAETGFDITRPDGAQPAAGARYTVRVRAVVAGNAGPWTTSEGMDAVTLDPPADVRLTYDGATLLADWTEPEVPAPLTGPLEYYVALVQWGMEVGAATEFRGTRTPLPRHDGRAPQPGEVYNVQMMAQLPQHSSAWATSAQITIPGTPRITAATYAYGVLTVAFDSAESPAPAVDSHDIVAAGPETVEGTAGLSPAELSLTGRPFGTYQVRIRGRVGDSVGAWSGAVAAAVVDPPTDLAVRSDGTGITVTWTAVADATGYEVRLTDPADGSDRVVRVTDGTTARFAATGLTRGVARTVTAATQCGDALSAASAPATVMLVDPPQDVRAAYDGTRVTATWRASTGATGYRVTLTDENAATAYTADVTAPTAPTAPTADIPATGLTRGAEYRLTVTALAAPNTAVDAPAVPVVLLDPPTGVTAVIAGTEIRVGWTAVPYATNYLVTLTDPSDVQTAQVAAAQPPVPFGIAGLRRGVTYTVRVQTQARGGTSAASRPAAVTVPVDPPTGLVAVYDGTNVVARWTAVVGATGYTAVLLDAGGATVGTQRVTTVAAAFAAAALTRGGAYGVTVTAQADAASSAPSQSASVTVLDPPGGVAANYAADVVSASWNAAPGASGYSVTVTDPSGSVVNGTRVGGRQTTLPATGFTRGAVYRVAIAATAGTTISRPSAPVPVTVIDPPTGLTGTYDGTVLTVSWTAAPGATGYDVTLTAAGGPTAGRQIRLRSTSTTASIAATALSSGVIYAITASSTTATGSSTPVGPVQVAPADPPAQLTAGYDGSQIRVTWAAAPGAQSYRLMLRDPGGRIVQDVPTGTVTGYTMAAAGLTRGVPYTLVAATVIAQTTSRPSAAATVVLADPPPAPTLTFDGTAIAATWPAVPGVTGYAATLNDPSGAVVTTAQVPGNSASFPASGLRRGVPYTVTVATRYGTTTSRPSAPGSVTMVVDPPTGITASYDGTKIVASWQPVQGATTYRVQVLDPGGRIVATPTTPAATLAFPDVTPGVAYAIRVSSATYAAAPWSAAVPVVQNGYTCLCLGMTPGGSCANGGPAENFTAVALRVTRQLVDGTYMPTRPSPRTGWVAVVPGKAGHVAVLGQIVSVLTIGGYLSPSEAYAVFAPPSQIRDSGGGGPLGCFCMGTTPGANCGNGAPTDNFAGLFTGVTQADADGRFRPTQTGSRTGWVAVTNDSHTPLEVMLQLVATMAARGKFPAQGWDVFTKSMSLRITSDVGGTTTCVALGSPIGAATATMGGNFGDVVVNVPTPTLNNGYRPGPGTGWAAVGQDDYAVLSVLLRLVTTLARKGILTGTQPYDIFNNARAVRIR